MKRKLRIFSHIAIICLSVCMFAFGVYAASTVSVTTSGTVSFQATGVYGKVTRTVSGTANAVSTITQEFDASTPENSAPFKMGDGEVLAFNSESEPIIMTFEIQNDATDRCLNFKITDTSKTASNIYVTCVASCSAYNEETGIYTISNKSDSTDNIETIVIKFFVDDPNVSASLEYGYSIELSSADIQAEVSSSKYYVANTTLGVGKQLGYKYEGTMDFNESIPSVSSNVITSVITDYNSALTNFDVLIDDINTSAFSITKTSAGKASIGAVSWDSTTNVTYIPVAVNKESDGVLIISSVSSGGFSGTELQQVNSLPGGITTLEPGAFNGVQGNQLTISNGLTTIGYGVFNSSKYNKIRLSNNTTSIGNNAFSVCQNLTELIMSDSIITIGGDAFSLSDKLFVNELPRDLQTIGENAFFQCSSITEITLYSSITEIGATAFRGTSLTTINYDGTQADWNKITIGEYAFDSGKTVTVKFSDGTSITL